MFRKALLYIVALVCIIISFPNSADAEAVSKVTVKDLIVKHSMEMGIDPAIALSIAKAESGYCHEKRSRYGAVGVFQLMPSTAKRMGYNPYHINENIKGGIAYYKQMYKMFGKMELALAAYNAGPGNVKKYNGVPPFAETKKFVASIMNNYNVLKSNPDPSIARYKAGVPININYEQLSSDSLNSEIENFRFENEAILKSYLSNQGI
ncbi:lytic transglycosylase domain-containing protein [bacterium]|nr:lytic transglycosylase domain-containing protein [bacterium]